MNTRVNPFATLSEPPVFTTKAKTEKPVQTETIERIAEENNFPSRQATKVPPKEPRRKRRIYTTGRNRQFNIKATAEGWQGGRNIVGQKRHGLPQTDTLGCR